MDTLSGKKTNLYQALSEKRLIAKSKAGDTKAFDELINRHEKFINGCINSFLKGNTKGKDTDEIYQLTLIKSWRYIGSFRGDCKFSTWLNRILRNLFYDDYRRKQRRKEVSYEGALSSKEEREREGEGESSFEINLPVVQPNRAESMDRAHLRKIIDKSLNKLSDNHKKVLILSAEEELPYSEIAKVMKCSVGTVMSRLFYARKAAQKHYIVEKSKLSLLSLES